MSSFLHVHIQYAVGPAFDYQLKRVSAEIFIESFQEWAPDAVVTIDESITAEMPLMPCAALWEP
ncbi:hypothetical protein ACWFRF_15550 [Nocardia sp. NPDC055165]